MTPCRNDVFQQQTQRKGEFCVFSASVYGKFLSITRKLTLFIPGNMRAFINHHTDHMLPSTTSATLLS